MKSSKRFFSYKSLITLAVFIVLSALAFFMLPNLRTPQYRCSDCNVILVSIDTLRKDHLGLYGYQRPTSPVIDEFSKNTAIFDLAISQAPSTTPSHASILTGVIPSVHKALFSQSSRISDSVQTLAESLKQAGYSTASFNGGSQLSARFGFDRGFDVYQTFERTDYQNERLADRISEAVNWMNEHKTERFFLFLHSYEVHMPYAPDASELALFETDYKGPLPNLLSEEMARSINKKRLVISQADKEHIVNLYDAEIHGMDAAFAELINYLKRSGLFDKSIIVFTSDHGDEMGEHGRMATHADTLYDELLRVPLLIKFPNGLFAGSKITHQVRSIDILPTILDVLGLRTGPLVQGKSLTGLLEGETEFDPHALSQIDAKVKRLHYSLRTVDWKFIKFKNRLFQLKTDPGELKNVARDFPEIAEQLKNQAKEILKTENDSKAQGAEVDQKTMEQLRSLGYVK